MMRQTPTTPTAGTVVMATVNHRCCFTPLGVGIIVIVVVIVGRRRRRRVRSDHETTSERQRLDDALSDRFIALDPAGYFLVWTNDDEGTIGASHFDNVVGEDGLARDPETGEVIPCDGSYKPKPTETFQGRTAKEISVEVFESGKGKGKCSMMTHANYLGREFQRREECLRTGKKYVQD